MYERTNWQARQGTGLNKFTETERSGNTVVLINTPDTVTVPGTPFSTENMNHIEEGIYQAHEAVAAEAQARQREIEELRFYMADIISLINSNMGPLNRFLLGTDDGSYLGTDDGDYLAVA